MRSIRPLKSRRMLLTAATMLRASEAAGRLAVLVLDVNAVGLIGKREVERLARIFRELSTIGAYLP